MGKVESLLAPISGDFRKVLTAMGLGQVTEKKTARIKDMVAFVERLTGMHTAFIRSGLYKGGWKDDGLDIRAVFAELNGKFRRLKTVVWDDFEDMDAEEAYKGFGDLAITCLLGMRRLEEEHGVDWKATDDEDDDEDEYVVSSTPTREVLNIGEEDEEDEDEEY